MKIRQVTYLFSFFLLFAFGGSYGISQDSIVGAEFLPVNQSHSTIKYWKKGAYNAYPKDTVKTTATATLTYQSVKKKYHSSDFDYTDKKYKKTGFWERVGNWISDFFKSISPNWHINYVNIIIYILYGIGGFAILFIAYRIFYNKNGHFLHDPEESDEGEVEFVKRHLENTDLQKYIDKSLADENWNMAIRYLQLQILQLLAKKGQIEWDYRKTNQDFIYEIKDKHIKEKFSNTTTVFNYVWYGDFELDKAKFEAFKADFIQLQKELS